MTRKSVRLEVRLTPELYVALKREAGQRGQSMGMVVREAVGEYVAKRASTDKHVLLDQMLQIQAPVADWEFMKQEIKSPRLLGYDDDLEPSGGALSSKGSKTK